MDNKWASIQFSKQFGLEADRHLLRVLFSSIDFSDGNQNIRQSSQAKLLNQELNACLKRPAALSSICFAIDNCFAQQKVCARLKADVPGDSANLSRHERKNLIGNAYFSLTRKTLRPQLLSQALKILNCSPILQTIITLALTYSKNPEFVRVAEASLKVYLASLVLAYVKQGNIMSPIGPKGSV